ncbi:MAG TPA: hypothetical protein EYO33_08175 [Phycisphaerales bacterium]|nr:hypothetical protein [Phycisphaerales bacterium]
MDPNKLTIKPSPFVAIRTIDSVDPDLEVTWSIPICPNEMPLDDALETLVLFERTLRITSMVWN